MEAMTVEWRRLEALGSRSESGTGLDLAICYVMAVGEESANVWLVTVEIGDLYYIYKRGFGCGS
jgi:hypothetical protein